METREQWAAILKRLRETGEHVLIGVLSNLTVTFTHDTITIIAPNQGIFNMLVKYKDTIDCDTVFFRLKISEEKNLTIEQKLQYLFGEKLEVDVQ